MSEGVFGPDNSCDFASPLVIVQKKEDGIRTAVDFREVNFQFDDTANQLPCQPMQFLKLGGQKYFANVDILWGVSSAPFRRREFEGYSNYHSMGCLSLSGPPKNLLEFQQRLANIKPSTARIT